MKKIFGLLIAILLLTGCDDGEMTFQTFSFTSGLQKCDLVTSTKTYLSINTSNNEVLIINFPTTSLLNVESETDTDGNRIPSVIDLSNGAIEYRVYSGTTPTLSTICSAIDNGNINIAERWLGSGTVEVVTVKVTDETDGTISYQHSVTLQDVSFTKGEETIRILDNYLGIIESPLGFEFNFNENADSILSSCSDGRPFLPNDDEAILFVLAAGTFDNQLTTKTIVTSNTNYVRFRVYSGTVGTAAICNGALSPVLEQEWITTPNAATIRIVTTQSTSDPSQYLNDIYLENARFNNVAASTESFSPTPNYTDSSGTELFYVGRYVTQ